MRQFTLHRNVRRNVSKTQLFSGRFGKQRWWYVVVAKTFHGEQPLSSLLHCTTALQSSTHQRWLQNFKTKLFQIFSSVVVIQVHVLTRYRPLQWSFTTTVVLSLANISLTNQLLIKCMLWQKGWGGGRRSQRPRGVEVLRGWQRGWKLWRVIWN